MQVDVWSCGILLSMMVFGQHPFMEVEPDDECTPGTSDPRVQLIVRNKVRNIEHAASHDGAKLASASTVLHPACCSLQDAVCMKEGNRNIAHTHRVAHGMFGGAHSNFEPSCMNPPS